MKKKYSVFMVFLFCSVVTAQYQFTQVAEINPGSNSGSPRHFMEYNGELYFNASVSFQQRLYKTSGIGATLVSDLNGNGVGYVPKPLFILNNKLLFHASTQAHGMELFITDGTEVGTEILLDIYPGPNGSSVSDNPDFYAELNGELYFWARETSGPFSLWKTNGTTTGTVKVVDPSFAGGGTPMVIYNDKIYFLAYSATGQNPELYVTDGTPTGTGLFLEINPSTAANLAAGSSPNDLFVYDGYLFFSADDGTNGRELWRTDGTTFGTTMVADIFPNNLNPSFGKGSNPDYFIEFNNELYFVARGYDTGLNQITGNELYKYTIANGWNRVKDFYSGNLNSGIGTSNPFFIMNNELFIIAQDGTHGANNFELWKTDGTESGTIKTVNSSALNNISLESFIENKDYAILNNKLYFQHNSQQIWVTDGTNATTQQLTNTGEIDVPIGVTVFQPVVFNDEIYFDGNYPSQGVELWKITDTNLSLENFLTSNEITIYPNPTNGKIILNTDLIYFKIRVFDGLGNVVLMVNNQNEINLENCQSGLYFIEISDEFSTYQETIKVLKF
ncbi:T9SS type A sorting domain-containing protein [Flavobacterium piscinae]|uniref:T9SS type A sorting domain-containing protein n=1 Tax=Flavobacterium piscinae TaxID=2506424 RepID=A0A4Q1KLW9_9FLAO|nr:T9SS type A sorting domain-containing protein [Flavobacterium piscinae]MBC8882952.1 T9SS type A sorting domain-containing protein [Flavobacterium piscinae]RXR30159.1 T9SS type A sorting domain-containing protein [Flavobacterium piscinae]